MRIAVTAALLLLGAARPIASQTHVLVVTGLGGDAAHSQRFHQWATTFISAARDRLGIADENITYLAERPELDPAVIDDKSTKDNIERILLQLSERAVPGDNVFILLIGHGTYQGDAAKFNLPGADMSAQDFVAPLSRLEDQQVVFVNTASASGEFVPTLSAPGRVVVTATKSSFERNETVFCEYLVAAFAEDVADVDKDGRVSLLEAVSYAMREVTRFYESQSRLMTEHAVLDDNGDGVGSSEPATGTGDGALASRIFLDGAVLSARVQATDDSVLAALYMERDRLQSEIAELRGRKDTLEAAVYERELEALLLDLARTSQAIRQREGEIRLP